MFAGECEISVYAKRFSEYPEKATVRIEVIERASNAILASRETTLSSASTWVKLSSTFFQRFQRTVFIRLLLLGNRPHQAAVFDDLELRCRELQIKVPILPVRPSS